MERILVANNDAERANKDQHEENREMHMHSPAEWKRERAKVAGLRLY